MSAKEGIVVAAIISAAMGVTLISCGDSHISTANAAETNPALTSPLNNSANITLRWEELPNTMTLPPARNCCTPLTVRFAVVTNPETHPTAITLQAKHSGGRWRSINTIKPNPHRDIHTLTFPRNTPTHPTRVSYRVKTFSETRRAATTSVKTILYTTKKTPTPLATPATLNVPRPQTR